MKFLITLLLTSIYISGALCADREEKKASVEIPQELLDRTQFAEYVAIVTGVQAIFKTCKEVESFNVPPLLSKPTIVDKTIRGDKCWANKGHSYTASEHSKAHSIASLWGTKEIVTDITFKPRQDGLKPSGNLDKAIMKYLGLQNFERKGYQYLLSNQAYHINTIGNCKVTVSGDSSIVPIKALQNAWSKLSDEYQKIQEKKHKKGSRQRKKIRNSNCVKAQYKK
jgi:hypothetical protein